MNEYFYPTVGEGGDTSSENSDGANTLMPPPSVLPPSVPMVGMPPPPPLLANIESSDGKNIPNFPLLELWCECDKKVTCRVIYSLKSGLPLVHSMCSTCQTHFPKLQISDDSKKEGILGEKEKDVVVVRCFICVKIVDLSVEYNKYFFVTRVRNRIYSVVVCSEKCKKDAESIFC